MAGRALIPLLREYICSGAHRLISTKYSVSGTVLEDVADGDVLAKATRLDAATNDRIEAESYGLLGISPIEMVHGIPNAQIIRAAFLHPGYGARFHGRNRGAWYASEELLTSVDEVAYHRSRNLSDIEDPDEPLGRPSENISTYDDWLADFHASFHSLESAESFAEYLKPEPVPECYSAGQALAKDLLLGGSNGIVYPSVRRKGGTCIACFRPPLVFRPRYAKTYQIRVVAGDGGYTTDFNVLSSGCSSAPSTQLHIASKRKKKK